MILKLCVWGPCHRTCFGVGFGSDVPKRPFQGKRTVYTPSGKSGGIGKKGEGLIGEKGFVLNLRNCLEMDPAIFHLEYTIVELTSIQTARIDYRINYIKQKRSLK